MDLEGVNLNREFGHRQERLMSMSHGSFATAINCMDGRTQIPVTTYLKKRFGVDHVDMITEPGPIKALAENRDAATLNSIKRRVDISTQRHGSRHIAVVGHHDCAGNPVDEAAQLRQIVDSVKALESWGTGAEVIGLWVDEHWQVREVK